MSRWFLQFDAINPANPEDRWKTGIHQAHYRRLQVHGHEKALARIMLVNDVLTEGTLRIYGGWSRPDKDDCFVYVGRPTREFKSLSIETPPPPGMVFLVFVLPDGTVDDWNWRPCQDNSDEPQGVEGELIWTAPS